MDTGFSYMPFTPDTQVRALHKSFMSSIDRIKKFACLSTGKNLFETGLPRTPISIIGLLTKYLFMLFISSASKLNTQMEFYENS